MESESFVLLTRDDRQRLVQVDLAPSSSQLVLCHYSKQVLPRRQGDTQRGNARRLLQEYAAKLAPIVRAALVAPVHGGAEEDAAG